MAPLAQKFETFFDRLDQASGGWVSILRHSVLRFIEMRGTEAAASLAYYALFSFFPLILLLAALLGFVVKSELAYYQVFAITRDILPFAGDIVAQNLREILNQRGTIGLIGFLALLWSASGFFNTLARSINLAWPKVKLRSMLHNRLIAIGMMAVLFFLLLLSLISSMLVSLVPFLLPLFGANGTLQKSREWILFLRGVSALITYLLFVALYRWVPNKDVRWRPVLIGALVVTLVWELAKQLFNLYANSGLAQYQFIYGSLGTLIALLVWIYFSSLIALLGAYLVASLDLRADQKQSAYVNNEQRGESELPKGIHG